MIDYNKMMHDLNALNDTQLALLTKVSMFTSTYMHAVRTGVVKPSLDMQERIMRTIGVIQ